MIGSDLYKRSFGGTLMRCLDKDEAFKVMTEVHEGSCGNHSGGRALAQKITRQGYFWPTVIKDSHQFSRGCNECQRFAKIPHRPTLPMIPTHITCPFDQWGIDIVGKLPNVTGQKMFIIVAVEYFT